MRTGPILAERRSERVDRSDDVLALWEVGAGAPVRLPYHAAGASPERIQRLIRTCSTAVVAVGAAPCSATLLGVVLDAASPGSRIYLYAADTLAEDDATMKRLAHMGALVLPRFGPPPPADWVVADGRRAVLQCGPPGEDRRWLIDMENELARSLFQAFGVLFWDYAEREGLPDGKGQFAVRPPLPAPVSARGPLVELVAGRFWSRGAPPLSLPNAEIRVLPSRDAAEGANLVFLPPDPGDFAHADELAAAGAHVVWSDLGLPKTAVSTERMLVDLVSGTLGLQLEWPKGEAIRLLQSLKAIAAAPQFEFYPSRPLGAVRHAVLLPGWTSPQSIRDRIDIDLGDVVSPLDSFEAVKPDLARRVMDPALSVEFVWRNVPARPPADARVAAMVRAWRLLDEWGVGTVSVCRTLLDRIEPGDGAAAGFSARLIVMAQAPLSRDQTSAAQRTADLRELSRELREAVVASIVARREAQISAEEERQRQDWTRRTQAAAEDMRAHAERTASEANELDRLSRKLAVCNETLAASIRDLIEAEREKLIAADRDEPGGRAPKAVRKAINATIQTLEQQAAAVRRSDHGAIERWSALPDGLADVWKQRQSIGRERESLRTRANADAQAHELLARKANEAFVFRPPALPQELPLPQDSDPPAIPSEALPEIGELLEHGGRRYLAIKTWSQFVPAGTVAHRLNATLVSANPIS